MPGLGHERPFAAAPRLSWRGRRRAPVPAASRRATQLVQCPVPTTVPAGSAAALRTR